ncbi:MAG: hypothetical protein HKP32_08180 [Woeseia sp.]|nr:hypothetical protein [Woeseia sp.]NNL55118.1 hypothetical protein [Woeseia sp.]
MSDIDQILRDPSASFAHPGDVLRQSTLSRDEQIRVLKQWRYDLVQMQVASAENLGGDTNAGAGIRSIDECLRQLSSEVEAS